MVSGILVLIGKIAFLLALYGFMLVVYRGLLMETRRAAQPDAARRDPAARPSVERWELRPPTSDQPAVRAAAPPRVAATPAVAPPTEAPAAAAGAVVGAVAGAAAASPDVTPPTDAAAPEASPAEAPAAVPEPAPVVPAMLREPTPPPTPAPAAPEPASRAALVVLTAPEAGLDSGRRLPLSEVMRLGRAEDNHVILHDRFVSSHHAEVSREAGGYVLRDLGSTNGTFRNGARLDKSVVLQEGDRIGIGTSMFTFHSR